MTVYNFPTKDDAIIALAKEIVTCANKCIKQVGQFNFVLTGGNSPKKLYRILATTHKNNVDWRKVYFFFGDERYILPDHAEYNGLMAKETILDPLNIPKDQIFYVPTQLKPAEAAETYQQAIQQHFKNRPIVFDLILLGMGGDGHTASLFPHTTILNSQQAGVESVYVDKLSSWRISFTAPLINQANEIAFLVFGNDKSQAFQKVLSNTTNSQDIPAKLIQGKVSWYTAELAE